MADDGQPNPADVPFLRGALVRLAPWEPDADAETFAGWQDEPAYLRSGEEPAVLLSRAQAREQLDRWARAWPESANFAVRLLADDRLVGMARLYDLAPTNRNAILGLSIPSRDDWGKGLGADALRVILRYGFGELGLHRVWLDVLASNDRAIRLYRRAGFREEGRLREHLRRDGRWWDVVYMGLLRSEYAEDGRAD